MGDLNFNEHEHDEDCDCGDRPVLQLQMENGQEISCEVLGLFDIEEQTYIALLPENDDNEEILFYKYQPHEDEKQFSLSHIESEEELEKVEETFYEVYLEDLDDDDFDDDDFDDDDFDDEDDDFDDDDFDDDFDDEDDEDFDEDDFDDDDFDDDDFVDDDLDDDDFDDDADDTDDNSDEAPE